MIRYKWTHNDYELINSIPPELTLPSDDTHKVIPYLPLSYPRKMVGVILTPSNDYSAI